jgi:predicted nucleic acid-binding protein
VSNGPLLPLTSALIAATAIGHHLPVYTCNAADFEGIEGLQVVPVKLPQQASS